MPEDRSSSTELAQSGPKGSADLPLSFEPAFRAVQELFNARLLAARTRVDRMAGGWEEADKRCTKAIYDHSSRKKHLLVSAGLMRPTNGPSFDRSGFAELLESIGTPETRALATDIRLDDEFARRGEKRDKELDDLDVETLWTADERVLEHEGVFEPEAKRHMLGELRELRARSEKLDSIRGRMSTEMRRIRLYSLRESDFSELDELFKKRRGYLAMQASGREGAGRKDRRGSSPQGLVIRLAENSGRIMALLSEMGSVRSGPEEFTNEAISRMCADIEETITIMDAICSDTAAVK